MRRTPALAALLISVSLGLAACGTAEEDTTAGTSGDVPTATGEVGEKPEVEVPEGDPSDELVVEVLAEGEGSEVQAGEFLVANYLGQTWEPGEGGEPNVFDNSYDRGQPAGFGIGSGAVIPGWDEGLVGQTVGSRVLLVIPPEQGYGEEGTPDGSIPPDSTLVFVIDILESVPADAAVSGEPVADLAADVPVVQGDGTEAPTVSVDGLEPPSESDAVLVLAGDGEPIEDLIVAKIVQVSYSTGETQYSSWDQQPALLTTDQLPGLVTALEGQNVGSRAVVRVTAADNAPEGGEGEALALVVDVVATV
ncbi:MAG TPA: FKBP-type peptidyl-prolyl cis-trans isomerase [Jiangellales bacterium]|nr:FKBP-type peptidyl-prolyl cis-trans isomerase [Jiangellales bacterium]